MHSWNQHDWKVSKRTMEREYGSLAKQVFGSVLFDWDRKGAIYTARTTNFIFWIQLEKHPLCQTCESMWGQTLAEQLRRHTMGIVISTMCDIDKWFWCFKLIQLKCLLSNYEKKTLQYKVFATNQLTVFYRDVLKYCTFRVLFFGKRNAWTIDFLSLIL